MPSVKYLSQPAGLPAAMASLYSPIAWTTIRSTCISTAPAALAGRN
jgi:hypothetical protein